VIQAVAALPALPSPADPALLIAVQAAKRVTEPVPAQSANKQGVTIAYVNDNHGDWSAGRPEVCARALSGADPARVEPILPEADVAFLTKARHSIFYETQLDYMFRRQGVQRIILTGQVTEQCILYSAAQCTFG
jgi:nicotinamidase-related amidase